MVEIIEIVAVGAVEAQVDPQSAIARDRVACNPIAVAAGHVDPIQAIEGDHVTLAGRTATHAVKAHCDGYAVRPIGQRRHAGGVGADDVAQNHGITGRNQPEALRPIPGQQIPRRRVAPPMMLPVTVATSPSPTAIPGPPLPWATRPAGSVPMKLPTTVLFDPNRAIPPAAKPLITESAHDAV